MKSTGRTETLYTIIAGMSLFEAMCSVIEMRCQALSYSDLIETKISDVVVLIDMLSSGERAVLLSDPMVAILIARWSPESLALWCKMLTSEERHAVRLSLLEGARFLRSLD